ncbi:MAG: hypothetical protein VKO21_03850 [Candidatus Sericytochromatia bacterium]|nr:hypothetical protein [Candidatus Sericytochromatia bacterium]
MTAESTAITAQAPAQTGQPAAPPSGQTSPPNAFQHPRLADLLKRAHAAGGAGAVLIQSLYDLVHPQDTIVACYYSVDMGAGGTGAEANNFYSIDVVLVTSAYFINISLFPKAHLVRKRKIHTITDVQVRYDPPSPDELRTVQPGRFIPSNIALVLVFADERGQVVETWSMESTAPDQVRNLFDIARFAEKCVGYPLANVARGGGSV